MPELVKVRLRLSPTASRKAGRGGSSFYMPHLRVRGTTELLGVAFVDGPAWIEPGQTVEQTMALVYLDTGVDYASLQPGIAVQVVEGSNIVGEGDVVERWTTPGDWRAHSIA